MKEYIKDYIYEMESKLKNKTTKEDINDLLIKINFFQHERLVHLIVTLFCVFILLVLLYFSTKSCILYIPSFIILIMVIFYILHYFFLENSVQKLYKIYDKMIKKI